LEKYIALGIPRIVNVALGKLSTQCLSLRWANDQAQPNRTPRGQRKQQMTTWRYQVFITSSREAEADDYQGLQDELNDLGQQGWELTAVTDAGDAKVFILKQRDQNIIDPLAQA
jgi:hypothetical protein